LHKETGEDAHQLFDEGLSSTPSETARRLRRLRKEEPGYNPEKTMFRKILAVARARATSDILLVALVVAVRLLDLVRAHA
jgi:hypothetical protein